MKQEPDGTTQPEPPPSDPGIHYNTKSRTIKFQALFAVVPFNIVKGVLVSILTMLLYKRVEKVFFRRRKST